MSRSRWRTQAGTHGQQYLTMTSCTTPTSSPLRQRMTVTGDNPKHKTSATSQGVHDTQSKKLKLAMAQRHQEYHTHARSTFDTMPQIRTASRSAVIQNPRYNPVTPSVRNCRNKGGIASQQQRSTPDTAAQTTPIVPSLTMCLAYCHGPLNVVCDASVWICRPQRERPGGGVWNGARRPETLEWNYLPPTPCDPPAFGSSPAPMGTRGTPGTDQIWRLHTPHDGHSTSIDQPTKWPGLSEKAQQAAVLFARMHHTTSDSGHASHCAPTPTTNNCVSSGSKGRAARAAAAQTRSSVGQSESTPQFAAQPTSQQPSGIAAPRRRRAGLQMFKCRVLDREQHGVDRRVGDDGRQHALVEAPHTLQSA